jgi:transmembrane sensor
MKWRRDITLSDPIMDEAMDWRLLQEERELSQPEREALASWLGRSQRHRDAYDELESFWSTADVLDHHPEYQTVRRQAEIALSRRRVTRRAMAAGLAAAIVGMGGLGYYLQLPKPLADQTFKTAVGQTASVTLPDGSSVTLNTDTIVRTQANGDRRLVYLDKGQAYFEVAKDRRHPFVVTAAGRTVTALGTAFDVRVDGRELKVVLVEGKVRVQDVKPPAVSNASPSQHRPARTMTTDMSAGSELVTTADTEWRLTLTDTQRETSWLKGQLVFESAPLAEVVEEMNRYSLRKITIADPALANRPIGGRFTPGDIHGFSMMLQAADIASLREESDGTIKIVALDRKSATRRSAPPAPLALPE